ncbi:MAG: aldo/keto reductase [Bacteroidota bacterium]
MPNTPPPIQFSPLIIGTMRLGVWGAKLSTQELENFIDQCLEMGLNDFDHADIYGHYTEEANFGNVLKRRPDLRNKMQITTKCGIQLVCPERPGFRLKSYNSTKAHIISSAENSLKDLGTDYLDLLLIHRPDFLSDPSEIAGAFQHLSESGKVRHFGVSNFTPTQMDMLSSFTNLVNNQVEISLLKLAAFTDGTIDKCWQHKITPTAWSPLAGGQLFGESDDPVIARVQKTTRDLAVKHEATLDQVLLAFLMKHPIGIVPVLGTSKIIRIKSALRATEVKLTHEDWYELWQAATGEEVA